MQQVVATIRSGRQDSAEDDGMIDVRVISEPFDPFSEQRVLLHGRARTGALVSFLGLMRDHNDGAPVDAMTLEHYPGMTEKSLRTIAEEAMRRWPLEAVRIVHRIGTLTPEDPIVLVAVASSHRGDAFRACEFLIDYLKTRAPFWKRESTSTGPRWVAARAADDLAAGRWDPASPDGRGPGST
jgi:molybdopterin synthase catalytic subunit